MALGRTLDILVSGARGTRPQGPGACRDCGNKVWWVVTPLGAAIPFDVRPDPIARSGDVETVSSEQIHLRTCEKRGRTARQQPLPELPPDRRFKDD